MSKPFRFEIYPLERFDTKASTSIKRPREFAHFSYDENHKFRLDDSSLRYYYTPQIGADLSQGFADFNQLDDSGDDHLDGLLRAVVHHEKKTGTRVPADIMTWRGMMTKIMSAPFDRFNQFEMRATRFQNTIFIEEDHAAKLVEREAQRGQQQHPGGSNQDLMSYWGYKFEALSLIPKTWDATSREYIEGRESHVVSNHAQYCSIVQTGIGSTSMVLGGEVDAVWDQRPEEPDQPINWVELKTHQQPESVHDSIKFERKLCKMWVQSFLLGVPKIIIGFRSRTGILQYTQEFHTQKIPGEVKRNGHKTWDGNLAIKFTELVLGFLKESISSDGVWRIRRSPKSSAIEVSQVEPSGTGTILSEEFLQWRKELYAQEVAAMLGGRRESDVD